MDGDIIRPIGMEDKKTLLFDGFTCQYKGVKIGKVAASTVKRLRKRN